MYVLSTSPGQYLQNICDPRTPGCVPCHQKYPTCKGLPDGDNLYPGREMTEDYIVCQSGRTVAALQCANGVFYPDRRECNVILDEGTFCLGCLSNIYCKHLHI